MRLIAYILGTTITLLALYLSYIISPILKDLFFKPIVYISTILDKVFIDMPYTIHSLLIFTIGIFLFFSSIFFIRIVIKKLLFKRRVLL